MTKYIFVTGGVISGLGKGVTSASIGAILQMLGVTNLTIKKLDPYLNVDPGTMNPIEHGEVYVTDDGGETDLDLGYYERFLELKTTKSNSTSSGKLFQKLLENERKGKYLGQTVQMIPHFTNMIKEFICLNNEHYDYIICEIGGSVGDIEAMAFYEAIRQLRNDIGIDNILFIHLTYLLYYPITQELKTKPTQTAIRELQQVGITPDILICRTEYPISNNIKNKLSLHTNLPVSHIIEAMNVDSIYQVPLCFLKENVHSLLKHKFNISEELNSKKWVSLNNRISSLRKTITIGILGKYTELNDSYKSLLESIFHAGLYHNYKIDIQWINARENSNLMMKDIQGVIIPGGFGITGIETMITFIQLLRERKIPTLGICLGMQLMIIEFCRNSLNMKNAGSSEFENYSPNVISKMNDWSSSNYGGTMRLGNAQIHLSESSKIKEIYQKERIVERHRHRYDVNNIFSLKLEGKGFRITGRCFNHNLIEVVELEDQQHPWYIGVQYHPEYHSNPFNPHPLFVSYIQQCIDTNIKNKIY
jgi:CTP synthase